MNSAIMGTASSGQPARLSSKYNASFQARVHGNAGSLGKDSLARRKRMIAAGTNGSNLPNIKKTPGLNPSSNNRKMQPSVQSKRQQQPASQGQRVQQQLQSPRLQGNGHRLSLKGRPDGSVQRQRIGQNGLAQIHGGLKSEKKRLDPGSKLMVTNRLPLTQLGTIFILCKSTFFLLVQNIHRALQHSSTLAGTSSNG